MKLLDANAPTSSAGEIKAAATAKPSCSHAITALQALRYEGSSLSPAIHGELVKMEGQIYTVKDKTGRTQQLRIDRETKMGGVFRTGDYMQAWVLSDGRTESIIAYKDMGQSFPIQP
jgi:hypothetical protein